MVSQSHGTHRCTYRTSRCHVIDDVYYSFLKVGNNRWPHVCCNILDHITREKEELHRMETLELYRGESFLERFYTSGMSISSSRLGSMIPLTLFLECLYNRLCSRKLCESGVLYHLPLSPRPRKQNSLKIITNGSLCCINNLVSKWRFFRRPQAFSISDMGFFLTAIDVVMASTFLYILAAFQDHRRRRGLPYPPGPTRWPIIGNLLNSSKQSPWIAYTDMSRKHG